MTPGDDDDERFARAAAAFGVAHLRRVRISPRVTRATVEGAPSVRRDDVDVALKVFDAPDASAARIEAALLAHVNAQLARAPSLAARVRVQSLMESSSAVHVVDVGHGRVAIATRWEPGEKRRYSEIDDELWFALGRALAALHEALGNGNVFALPDAVAAVAARDLARERATLLSHRDDVARTHGARFAKYFDDRARLLDAHGPASLALSHGDDDGPLHNDYNEHNYLFTAASRAGAATSSDAVPLILDFERAVFGPRELEVVRCLNHLPLVAPARARRFVDGYRSVRALRAERLDAALDAALTAHAVKHWPVQKLLRDDPGAFELVEGMAAMVAAFVDGATRLREFFATVTR